MPYNLPHAVLALLQQEGSQPQPKAYFVRSSSKSTKITLVYSKRRRREKTAYHNFSLPGSPNSSHDALEATQLYSTSCPGRRSAPAPPSASPPFSATQVLPEGYTFPSRSVCPTETSTTTTSREGRGMSVRGRDGYEFNTTPDDDDDDEEDDDDLNDHYIALSPSLYGDDIPPTPGRDFEPSESPRPPTPNIMNYNFLVSSRNKGLTTESPSRQATIEYDEGHFPASASSNDSENNNPINENVRKETENNGHSSALGSLSKSDQQRHSRPPKYGSNGDLNTGNSSNTGSCNGNNTTQQQSSKRTSRLGPPITIQAPSPDNHRRRQQQQQQQQQHDHQHRSHSDRRHDAEYSKMSGKRPPYQRVASWDGARP